MNWKYKIKLFILKYSLFKHHFHNIEGFVYVDKDRKPTNDITETVRWLGTVDVYCRYKDKNKKAIEAFNELYPQYEGYVCIF